jgi:predicted unusual protein kinase regulating ubiquinone biosynthesis (AarF/ABC1/UbiB family)
MKTFSPQMKSRPFFKFSTWTVLLSFFLSLITPPRSYAQESLFLPNPGTMIVASPNFIPPVMKGIRIFPDNPLRFDFIIDTGHANLAEDALKTESTKLIKYFLAALTVPEDDLWVNLSPYEKDRIIADKFGVTEMGRDLLAQDYVLKQLTASLIYPEEDLGKKFWDKVYAKVNRLYGTTNLPVNTFNKVWIVPDKAVVYESGDTAFIVASHLKVMLEGDYLALKENMTNENLGIGKLDKDDIQQLNDVSSAIIKEIVLPEIEKEVNTGKNFTSLRQVYNSMILATWFKRNLKESLLSKVYVGENKIAGVDIEDKQVKEKIYQQYLEAFKKGVYNYIKEDYDPTTQELVPRKYFSGGMNLRAEAVDNALSVERRSERDTVAEVSRTTDGRLQTVSAVLDPVKNLDRLRRVLNLLAQSDQVPRVPEGASEDVILEFVLNHLESNGFIKEIRDESDDVKVFVIKDEVKESELGRAVQRWVMEPRGGVKAVNFKGTDGIWKIVGFESDIDQQLDLEREEVKERKAGKHWIVAHNNARQKISGGDNQIDEEMARQEYEVARRDIVAPSIRRVPVQDKKEVGKIIPGTPLKSQNEYNRDTDIKEEFLKSKDVVDRFIAPGREGFQQFQPIYDEVRSIIDRLLIAQGLNPKEFQFFLADTVEPSAYIVSHYNTIVVHLGLIQMMAEYAQANNIQVTRDALAWVLAHEIQHMMQDRREIDEGRIDEKKGLVDSHAEDRGKEYQSDLLALWLMDRGGFSVKVATHVFQGLSHYLKTRGEKSAVWGTHPQIEERLRRLEHDILSYHWQNQDARASLLNSVSDSHKRTNFRQFQERVINVTTASDLVSLFNQAVSIDELLFAMLIGFELLPDAEKRSLPRIQAAFEQQISMLTGEDEAKKVLFEYMKNEVYVMPGLMREPNLDTFRQLGAQLSVETILRIYELGVPNLFSLSIDVDKLRKNKRHKQTEQILRRLNSAVYSLGGPTSASDRFKTYASGFLYGLYTRMIRDTQQGKLTLQQARRFLTDLVEMKDSQGYFKGYLFTSPLGDMVSALGVSTIYRGQLEAEDVKLIIRVYEILGTKVNYALEADGLAKTLYELAQDTTPAAKNEIMDWLVRRDDGWNSLRAEFLKLDIQTLFKEGQSIVFQGSRVEYLDSLLANKNVVRNMRNVLKAFVEAAHARVNNISSEELVLVHQKIFTKFREEHINNDLGIFWDLRLTARGNAEMFAGDAFERVLLENIPAELRPLVERTRRELRPVFYVIALGGIPEKKDLRDFIFGALRVREKAGSMLSDPEIIALIKNAKPKYEIDNEEDLSDRYKALSNEDKKSIRDRWNQINPERRIENVNDDEFALITEFLDRGRQAMGVLLSEKDATPAQQEEAFGRYTAPIYLQALFIQIGHNVRLNENDVGYGNNAWDLFSGDISRLVKLAEKQRPRNVVRFLSENITFDEFLRLFDFVSLLPRDYETAVNVVIKAMPPSVFRNFVLHMVFVNRILQETGYAVDNNSFFDMRGMQAHIAGLSSEQRAKVLSAIAAIAPHFVYDEIMETSNKMSVTSFWRERYSKNASKLDESAVRQQHDQEVGRYEDIMYTNPGGPIAQLLIFVSRLADSEIENTLKDPQLSLSSKREMIERYYPQSSSARDRWIKAAIQAEGLDKTVDEIEKLLAMIYSNELRDNLALSTLDRYRSEHPGDFESLNDALETIQRFFPEASLIRDDVLVETAQYLAKTHEQYEEVRKLYLDPFKKTNDLDLKETARTAMNQDIFRGWMTNRSPSEKAHFLLWLMGVTDEKPFFLVDFEYNFHVNADSLREDFGRRQSQHHPLAGQSSQREALEPFLYGEKGIFNDGAAMANLLNGMFDYLIKDGPNKTVLKKVFDKVFEKADQSRREEIFLSLVWTLSLQRGEVSGRMSITSERQEARAVRMFLESLGLVGRQLAQVLARSLWVTPLMRDELSQVQDSARKMDKRVVFDMLEKFGLTEQFESIEEPLGSAKIAGVYRAKMRDGRVVAIKVKRPEVDKTIEADMKLLKDVFDENLRSTFMAEGIIIPDNFIAQIEEGFRQELDFEQEAKNTAELGSRVQRTVLKRIKEFSLKKLFGDTRVGDVRGDYEFYVPQIIEVFNNSAIVMEYIEGLKLSSEAHVREAGVDQKDVEVAVANELLREIFYEGFYHGDPHLGNILIQKGENGRVRIVLIDAGASFGLNKSNRRLLGKLMVAVRDSQKNILESIVQELGGVLNDDIRSELTTEVLQSRNSVGQKLLWFFHILEKNHIAMPNELLNIMRFFATGQALFNYGEAASTNETPPTSGPTSGTTEDSAILAEQLDTAIDQAQDVRVETSSPTQNPGGIDLNPNMLELQTQGQGINFDIPIDPQTIQIDGFSPVIFQIIPTNLPLLIGGAQSNQPEQRLSSIQ